jgi:acetyltransferase-like isoleucine patch superfamily enzyme
MDAHTKPRAHLEDPLGLFPWALSKLYTLWLRATYPFASIGRNFSAHYTFRVERSMARRVKIGNSVSLGKDVWLNIIPEATDEINIVIDDNCLIAPRSWISAKNLIHLERDVLIEPSVLIMDHGHVYENPNKPIRKQPATPGGRIRIGQGCRIGSGAAIVCSGSELVLGQNSVVGPNSVVVRSQPAYSYISGNPARVIERLDQPQADSVSQSDLPDQAEPVSEDCSDTAVKG